MPHNLPRKVSVSSRRAELRRRPVRDRAHDAPQAACYAGSLSTADPVYTWLFVRGAERLTIERPNILRLVVAMPGGDPRTFDFESTVALMEFQVSFERHLTATGWSLESFSPERRSGGDRRRAPRAPGTDRRVLSWRNNPAPSDGDAE